MPNKQCAMCEKKVPFVGVMRLINNEKKVHFDFEVCPDCFEEFKGKAQIKAEMISRKFDKREGLN